MDKIACIFEIAGAIMVGNRNKYGFVVFMVGNCFWLLTGMRNSLVGLVTVSVVFFVINIRNYRKWGHKATINRLRPSPNALCATRIHSKAT